MPPGPKKKGRKDFSRSNVRQANPTTLNVYEDQEVKNEADFQNDTLSEDQPSAGNVKNSYQKYSRRQIQSNWDRYEEKTPGLLEDTLRGESFEVLACYQGGADSYLKLKEEKEWYNAKDFDNLHLDCDGLAQSLKCIPLHKRLHISEDCFTTEMLQKFKEAAERCRPWKPIITSASLSCGKADLPAFSTFSNTQEEDVSSEITFKPKLISEKTENIIFSLTNFTSQEDESLKKIIPQTEETPLLPPSNEKSQNSSPKEKTQDDLAFLLSLSGSDKQLSDVAEDKEGSSVSIEDWLNELLEK